MKSIEALEELGFVFTLPEGKVHYKHYGEKPCDEIVNSLILELKQHRDDAAIFLRERQKQQDLEELHLRQYYGKYFWEKGEEAEQAGDYYRAAQLFALAAEELGVTEPWIPWSEFINGWKKGKLT